MSLDTVLAVAWGLLEEGVTNRRKPFHTPAVASITEDFTPSIRTVVLRGVDQRNKTVRFHTDIRARKYAELTANPSLALLFYDETKKVQIRLETTACLHNRDEVAADAWALSQPMSKVCYATPISPGSGVSTPPASLSLEEANMENGYANFGVVEGSIKYLEWLKLSAKGHERAGFRWSADGTLFCQWLGP
ncbi:MAG: pyridoxamine 5'-phosphate oxidase family protein [Halieaceae bacterium]